MERKTPKARWIGLGTVGALAVAATVVTLSVTGRPHDGTVNLEAGKATNGPAPDAADNPQSTTGQHHAAEAKPTARSKAISPHRCRRACHETGSLSFKHMQSSRGTMRVHCLRSVAPGAC